LPSCAACRNPKTVPDGVLRPRGSAEVLPEVLAGAGKRGRTWLSEDCVSTATMAATSSTTHLPTFLRKTPLRKTLLRKTLLRKEDMIFSAPGLCGHPCDNEIRTAKMRFYCSRRGGEFRRPIAKAYFRSQSCCRVIPASADRHACWCRRKLPQIPSVFPKAWDAGEWLRQRL